MKHLKLLILVLGLVIFNSSLAMDPWSMINTIDTGKYDDPGYSRQGFAEDQNPGDSHLVKAVEVDLSSKEIFDELAACAQARAVNAQVRARAMAALRR